MIGVRGKPIGIWDPCMIAPGLVAVDKCFRRHGSHLEVNPTNEVAILTILNIITFSKQ